MPSYQYKPVNKDIDSIRLLVLHPAKADEDVRCELVHTTFRQKPSYEALSYTWGDEKTTFPIFLDGCIVVVRENLYTALRHLRLQEETRILWADAICIDQSNIEERKYQVSLMDFIYTRAPVVILWLGGFYHHLVNYSKNQHCMPDPTDSQYSKWVQWVCIQPYWNRLWIIQGIGLSRNLTICFGSYSVPWEQFVANISHPVKDLKGVQVLLCRLIRGKIETLDSKRLGRHQHSNRLEILLADFQYAQCTEIRDKIYGFVGLAHDCHDGVIVADYGKSLYDLYSDVILFFCRQLRLENGAVNDLDRAMRIVKFSQLLQRMLKTCYTEVITPSANRIIVTAKGAEVGRIVHIGPTCDEALSSSQANKKWRASFEQHYSLPQDVLFLREVNESYLGTMLNFEPHDLEKISNVYWNDPQGRFWSQAKRLDGCWSSKPEAWHHQNQDERINVADPTQRTSATTPSMTDGAGPTLFLGTNFLMGLVPCDAKVGDIICQFWETDVVALVRSEVAEGTDTPIYRVVGRVHLCTGTLEKLRPVYKPWNPIPESADSIVIRMDLDTLSFLTC